MRLHNEQEEVRIVGLWKEAFRSMQMNAPGSGVLSKGGWNINEAMQANYPGKKIWPVGESCKDQP